MSGKRKRKRFVFYLNYETVSFPIIFITKQMIRYTIEFPKDDEVMIRRNSTNEGMALFLGGGSSSENEYIFKIVKDE